ncbi:fatty acid desaturase [Bradyrhizobium diazoefficiens]
MNAPASPARPVAAAIRYLSMIVGCACLLLAAVCFAMAAQVALGLLALTLARVWK